MHPNFYNLKIVFFTLSLFFACLITGPITGPLGQSIGGPISITGSVAWAKGNNTQYNNLVKRYNFLEKDQKEGRLRHPWEQLENRFLALSKKSQGEIKKKSLYDAARSRHRLAQRSFSNSDYKKALKYYADFSKAYPKDLLAAEADLRSAEIQAYRFKDINKAKVLAQNIIKEFPQSNYYREATVFLEKLDRPSSPSSSSSKTAKAQSRPVATTPDQKAALLGLTVKTIMIDAGHGGRDPGAEGNGISEHNLTLKMANIIGKMLSSQGFKVLYTRSNNSYIALGKRTSMANDQKADLFISIHANANKNSKLSGLETYYLDSATSDQAAKVAARENAVSQSQLSDVQFILTDLMLNSKLKESKSLARSVHNGILKTVRSGKIRYTDNGVRPGPFYVLMGARMPAILVEMGYLTNKYDSGHLKKNNFLHLQAKGIVDGVVAYKKEVAKGIE